MSALLFEIGTEEIPAGYIKPALETMASDLIKSMDDVRIEHGDYKVYATPRRLGIIVDNVSAKQKPLVTELIGPPASVGFDEKGKPTIAAEKFAEKAGIKTDKIKTVNTAKGAYLAAKITEKGGLSVNIFKKILPDLIYKIPFPKSMRWSDMNIEFARPIQSLTAMLGGEKIPFSIEGRIDSDRYIYGHFFMKPQKIKLADAKDYPDALKSAYVMADMNDRKKLVLKSIQKEAKSVGGKIIEDEELLDIVTNLVEMPFPVVGSFDKKFLTLPDEILITSMREHQKYFAVVDEKGKLMPHFIAVNNTKAKNMKLVANGHERVIRARLEDAIFFYNADLNIKNETRIQKLKKVLFQAKLGSMYEKTERVKQIAEFLSDTLKINSDSKKSLLKAAQLCKSDLVSNVVGEFPKLQGIMGRVYAKVSKEKALAANAIEEHYMPIYSGGKLPKSKVGAILAIADKIDSISGVFAAGLIPTGASDPYSLRRQGIGILQIILDKKFSFSLKKLIAESLSKYKGGPELDTKEQTLEKIYAFLIVRMENILIEKGLSKDVVYAVTSAASDDILAVFNRTKALEDFKLKPDFSSFVETFKRVANIIKKANSDKIPSEVDKSLFEKKAEADLFDAYNKTFAKTDKNFKAGNYSKGLAEISLLKPNIDFLFDKVMVMTDKKGLKLNRLALLKSIAVLFERVGDFSKLEKFHNQNINRGNVHYHKK
ncbi:MAG: glycine--tRNA ligase subunit beta [Deltaproteobacteria bacterium]|nr:glycine--tRNA ligase subunit beta [Deltaproteobacteria bacterium]